MKTTSTLLLAALALIFLTLATPSRAETEKRVAFVVGNAAYQADPLATAANDAGLIAQTLQAAGFDVSGARDLDGESLRAAFRDFLDKVQASGPDTVAFVYLAGYGLQLDGENYFVPVDAKITSASDVAVEALRISDYTKRLAGLPLKASFIVLDAARESPFAKSGPPLAGGLALADAEPNMLLAFNATPGTVAPTESGPYGAYARALTEMIREGGLPPSDLFDGVRLRVNEETKGALVPWDATRIAAPFVFFVRAADAPPPALAADKISAMRSQPLGDLGAQDAYAAAIERDTLQGYQEFLGAYPSDPLAHRVRALLAARREAITWRRTYSVDTPDAYWSYLERYPRGPHVADARRRLATFAAALEPPPLFEPIIYDVPPPPPAEIIYVDRPVLVFSDPVFGFEPPPPVVYLAPVPAYLDFPPPPPPDGFFVLPVPVFVPVPLWVNPPVYVAAPPENVIFNNIHETTIINNNTNVINPGAAGVGAAGVAAGVVVGAAAGAIAAKVALPPSLAQKAAISGGQGAPGAPAGQPGAVPPAMRLPAAQTLPGTSSVPGVPLPGPGAKPGTPPAGPPGAVPSARLPAGHELPGTSGVPSPGPAAKPGTPPAGQPGILPSTRLPAGHELPGTSGVPSPGPAAKPGTPPAGQPGILPSTRLPAGHELPGTSGVPSPGPAAKPGTPPAGQPGALPSARLPAGHELPGTSGVPSPGPAAKPGTPPAGQPGLHPLPAGHELPGTSGVPSPGPAAKPDAPCRRRHPPACPRLQPYHGQGFPQCPAGLAPKRREAWPGHAVHSTSTGGAWFRCDAETTKSAAADLPAAASAAADLSAAASAAADLSAAASAAADLPAAASAATDLPAAASAAADLSAAASAAADLSAAASAAADLSAAASAAADLPAAASAATDLSAAASAAADLPAAASATAGSAAAPAATTKLRQTRFAALPLMCLGCY